MRLVRRELSGFLLGSGLARLCSLSIDALTCVTPPVRGEPGPSHAAQTSEFYEVGDACEWMDEAVADETPKAGLGEMLGPKPAFRH